MFGALLRHRALQGAVLRSRLTSQFVRMYADLPKHDIIKMPALSPTMTQGNLGTWQKKAGDSIAPGDVLVEIETDKAQMDFEFQEEGVIAKLLKESGEKDVAVGSPIAVLVEEGTDISAFKDFTAADAGGDPAPPAPKKKKEEEAKDEAADEAADESLDKNESKNSSKSSQKSKPAVTPEPEPEDDTSSSGKIEPALDRMIKKKELPPAKQMGVGASAGPATGASYTDEPISGMRKVIAQRLTESTQQNPHYFVTSSCSVTKLLKLRQALNSSADGKYKLSVNDFLIKAIAVASKRVPAVNSSWRGDYIRKFNNVDVSVAVSTPSGLITPIVPAVDTKGLIAISNSVKELAKRGRDGKLKPEEYQGGSISISNLGMNPAVERFTAVINPPQAAIVAVGTTRKVARPKETENGTEVEWDDEIVITVSFDHKVVDGAVGADWIRELKKVVENPLELLL